MDATAARPASRTRSALAASISPSSCAWANSSSSTEILEKDKFKVEIEETESSDAEPGTVLKQDPEADSMAETGATVTLTVAKEAKQDLPNVVGQQF
ncbi:PASTA domain-containing protein, partial [Streptomyces zhihengii]